MKWGMTKDEAIMKLSDCMWDLDKTKLEWKATLEETANQSPTIVNQERSSGELRPNSDRLSVSSNGGENSSNQSDE